MTDRLQVLRKEALAAYQSGQPTRAIELQRVVLSEAIATNASTPQDGALLAYLLYSSGHLQEATQVMDAAIDRHPDDADLRENRGILASSSGDWKSAIAHYRAAMERGSKSLNLLDAMCSALAKLDERDQALHFGRSALMAKDARFGAAHPLVSIPNSAPPSFDPSQPARNVISYSLWGAERRYLATLLENARLAPHLFPGWRVRVYADRSTPEDYRNALASLNVDVRLRQLKAGELGHRRLLWRFDVSSDPEVQRFLVRDADSLLTVKERVAVDDWLRSDRPFHIMRDHYGHTDIILAGMWGGVAGLLPTTDVLLKHYRPWRLENSHLDQDLLSVVVWPIIKQHCLIHDSAYPGLFGSVPFPPYGALPPGQHIGQNALWMETEKVG